MKHVGFIAILFPLLSVACLAEDAISEYRLVWADEFETDGRPNPKNWAYENGFVRNRELQWYQPGNAVCRGGRLIIEARREMKTNPDYEGGNNDWKKNRENATYTSSSLITDGLHSWKYGRFEIKARIKAEAGLWPAIWFKGVEGVWPYRGEIDLMEYYDGNLLANACWGPWDSSKKSVDSFNDPKWDVKFHIWRMTWDSKSIKLSVDGILLNTIDLTETINPKTELGPNNPFHQPHFLLLNLAIGSTGGDPSNTQFPTQYEIEYVRVFQKETPGE
jgi:beta-glucanase (GH16 family)